jgi:4-amino-4-deoxy-L-arabinose transferase-like glycosyltransferase
MSAERRDSAARAVDFVLLLVILAAALAARCWYLTAGVPHAVGIDEPQVVNRALRILQTGDWNPHVFDYPTLVIYVHAAAAILRFLWGALHGEWASLDAYRINAVYATLRFVAASIGVATVWLTYRLGLELSTRRVALLAAALLAVNPIHVRESHFVLTDVPMTALTTLSVWLAVRAGRLGSMRGYAWAGAACGFAAAAKYNGGIALVAVSAAWLVNDRSSPDRLTKLAAALAAAAAGFLAGAPFTIIDMPGFLDGFAAQFSRLAGPVRGGDPAWLLYVKHLSPPSARFAVPLALAGAAIVALRRDTRARWAPVFAFSAAYFYVLSSHSPVFARYALPLLPMLCLFSSAAVFEALDALVRVPAFAPPRIRRLLTAVAVVGVLFAGVNESVRWLDLQRRSDTRAIASDWLTQNTPRGTRVAVENSGPTYLDRAGFRVSGTQMLLDHGIDWYRQRVDYLVISAADLARYGDYLNAGPTVFQISPTPQRWGPPILIVRLAGT